MGIYLYDDMVPLDFQGLEQEEYQGHSIARCPGCKVWVAINQFYKADRVVIRAIPHKYPCDHYANYFENKINV